MESSINMTYSTREYTQTPSRPQVFGNDAKHVLAGFPLLPALHTASSHVVVIILILEASAASSCPAIAIQQCHTTKSEFLNKLWHSHGGSTSFTPGWLEHYSVHSSGPWEHKQSSRSLGDTSGSSRSQHNPAAHYALRVREYPDDKFSGRGSDVVWPPRSRGVATCAVALIKPQIKQTVQQVIDKNIIYFWCGRVIKNLMCVPIVIWKQIQKNDNGFNHLRWRDRKSWKVSIKVAGPKVRTRDFQNSKFIP